MGADLHYGGRSAPESLITIKKTQPQNSPSGGSSPLLGSKYWWQFRWLLPKYFIHLAPTGGQIS